MALAAKPNPIEIAEPYTAKKAGFIPCFTEAGVGSRAMMRGRIYCPMVWKKALRRRFQPWYCQQIALGFASRRAIRFSILPFSVRRDPRSWIFGHICEIFFTFFRGGVAAQKS